MNRHTISLEEFQASAARGDMPDGLSAPLQALWHEVRGDWARAHTIAQGDTAPTASWVHAYLHRKEGDLSNAGYWYRRAKRTMPSGALEEEWRTIAATLLEGEADD